MVLAIACLPDLVGPTTSSNKCGDGIVDLAQGEACDPGDSAAIGCTSKCQIECDGGAIDPTTDHCYFWAPPVQLKDNGVSECKDNSAHVVHFASLQELQLVISKCKTLPGVPDSGATWLALEKGGMPAEGGVQTYTPATGYELDLPGWSAACPGCFASIDGGDADIPIATGNGGSCVFWRRATALSWFQSDCDLLTTELPILCEREPAGRFSQPCADLPEAGADASGTCIAIRYSPPPPKPKKRYVLQANAASWAEAAGACAGLGTGAQLAIFQAPEEREEVANEVERYLAGGAGDVWLGLLFNDEGGAWTWIDGTAAPAAYPTPWGDGEPDGGSGSRGALRMSPGVYDTKLVHAVDGATPLPYLCEVPE